MFHFKTYEILTIILVVYHFYYLIDAIRSSFKEPINKIMWILLIILLPIVGCILYIFIGKNQKRINDN